jgi:hypothetical protein
MHIHYYKKQKRWVFFPKGFVEERQSERVSILAKTEGGGSSLFTVMLSRFQLERDIEGASSLPLR